MSKENWFAGIDTSVPKEYIAKRKQEEAQKKKEEQETLKKSKANPKKYIKNFQKLYGKDFRPIYSEFSDDWHDHHSKDVKDRFAQAGIMIYEERSWDEGFGYSIEPTVWINNIGSLYTNIDLWAVAGIKDPKDFYLDDEDFLELADAIGMEDDYKGIKKLVDSVLNQKVSNKKKTVQKTTQTKDEPGRE